ncbi:HPr-rel-A system PqqD family peptide chaperone [Undibacterium sp. SXout20W]|uniref:HPr-rel-A system PqqD family peptide chaperone n=1 Tax=Undibacterium sp. SXout20W TaxID=3413051 RepID=UPI003BF27B7E
MNEEYVVYEPISGSTHLLGEVAGQILLFLEYSPANVRRITAALFTQWEQAPSSEVERSIENVLEELRAMHLIECV